MLVLDISYWQYLLLMLLLVPRNNNDSELLENSILPITQFVEAQMLATDKLANKYSLEWISSWSKQDMI